MSGDDVACRIETLICNGSNAKGFMDLMAASFDQVAVNDNPNNKCDCGAKAQWLRINYTNGNVRAFCRKNPCKTRGLEGHPVLKPTDL